MLRVPIRRRDDPVGCLCQLHRRPSKRPCIEDRADRADGSVPLENIPMFRPIFPPELRHPCVRLGSVKGRSDAFVIEKARKQWEEKQGFLEASQLFIDPSIIGV